MGNKNGRPRGQAPKQEVLEREQITVALRSQGLTWEAIAQEVGYAHPASAREAFFRANSRVITEDLGELRRLEEDRLDHLQSAVWNDAIQGDLKAVDAVIKIMERRAKLLGLDAPRNQTSSQPNYVQWDGKQLQDGVEYLKLHKDNPVIRGYLELMSEQKVVMR